MKRFIFAMGLVVVIAALLVIWLAVEGGLAMQ